MPKNTRRIISKRVTIMFDGARYDFQTTPFTRQWLDEQISLQAAMGHALSEWMVRNEFKSLAVAVAAWGTQQIVFNLALYDYMQRH